MTDQNPGNADRYMLRGMTDDGLSQLSERIQEDLTKPGLSEEEHYNLSILADTVTAETNQRNQH